MEIEQLAESRVANLASDPITRRIQSYYTSGSAIRRMFEEGLRLKVIHGSAAVADMSIGNPVFSPPKVFNEALAAVAAAPGYHAYMPNAGYPWVRKKLATYLNQHGYFDEIDADQIIMTTGAAGALNVVLAAILANGDEVIVSRPYFLEYRFYVEIHGGVFRAVDSGLGLEISPESIESAITRKTKAIIVNSPNNPSGRIYRRATLKALAEMLLRIERESGQRIYLISDEPYRELHFAGDGFVSPASVYPNSFMCYSWSKSFSIPGERIGYLAVNPAMSVSDWAIVMGSLSMCNRILGFMNAPAFMQRAVGLSLDADIDVEHYRTKREMVCDALTDAGYVFARPEGTFYVFPRTPEPENDFINRCKRNLLLVVPGSAFGMRDYFRVSFAVPEETVRLGCKKLAEIKREIDESSS